MTMPSSEAVPPKSRLLGSFREFLEIIRDYGMPTVAFGAGIYSFVAIINENLATELKIVAAITMTSLGLFSQLWLFARSNPKVQSDEVRQQLSRMTDIVERLVESQIESKTRRS